MLQNSHSEARYESHIKFSSQIFYKNYYTNKNKYFFASIMAVAIQYYDQKYLFFERKPAHMKTLADRKYWECRFGDKPY